MIKVNLVPAEILAKAEQKQRLVQATAGGIVALALIVMISIAHYYTLNRLQKTLAEDQGHLKRLEIIVAKVEELEKTAAAVRARLNVITDLLKGRPLYPYFMSDFVRSVPAGIRVTALGTQGGGSGAAPLKLTISAEARANDEIAAWVKRLESTGRFSQTELGAVTGVGGAGGTFNFSLTSTYTPQL